MKARALAVTWATKRSSSACPGVNGSAAAGRTTQSISRNETILTVAESVPSRVQR